MAFCNKCGAVIAFAGGKCPRCGTMGEGGTATAGKVVVEDTGFSKEILLGKLERYKQLLGECDQAAERLSCITGYEFQEEIVHEVFLAVYGYRYRCRLSRLYGFIILFGIINR